MCKASFTIAVVVSIATCAFGGDLNDLESALQTAHNRLDSRPVRTVYIREAKTYAYNIKTIGEPDGEKVLVESRHSFRSDGVTSTPISHYMHYSPEHNLPFYDDVSTYTIVTYGKQTFVEKVQLAGVPEDPPAKLVLSKKVWCLNGKGEMKIYDEKASPYTTYKRGKSIVNATRVAATFFDPKQVYINPVQVVDWKIENDGKLTVNGRNGWKAEFSPPHKFMLTSVTRPSRKGSIQISYEDPIEFEQCYLPKRIKQIGFEQDGKVIMDDDFHVLSYTRLSLTEADPYLNYQFPEGTTLTESTPFLDSQKP